MPTIQRFGSVTIRMYPGDHRPPHFHIVGPDFQIVIGIADLAILAGEARLGQIAPALSWAEKNIDLLFEMWDKLSERGQIIMNTAPLPRISEVSASKSGLVLRVCWQGLGESSVDIGEPVRTYRLYRPLRDNPALFARAHVGEYGTDVVWEDGIDMAADLLWRLAAQQGTVPAQFASGSDKQP
jgi:hypothetical protein